MHARWTLTVPLTLNDGTPVYAGDITAIESRLGDIAGGFTSADAVGAWRGEDQWYREPVRVYTFDVGYIADGDVRRLAADIARWLDQEAVYATRQDIVTFLVTAPEREAVGVA